MPTKSSWHPMYSDVYLDKTILSNPSASGHSEALYRSTKTDFRITSANIPDWKARISRGLDVTTTLYGVRFWWKPTPGRVTGWVINSGKRDTWTVSGDIGYSNVGFSIDAPTGTVVAEAKTNSQVAFAKNYRKKTRQWTGGIFCGELLETARLLASPARALRKGVDELHDQLSKVAKRTKGDSRKTVRDAIAGTWLEWNFGVKPLVQDANDAATAFRAMASGRCYDIVRITGLGEAEAKVVSTTFAWNPSISGMVSSFNDWRGYREIYDQVQVITRGAWKNENPSGEMPLPMRFGVGFSDLVPTAWELIPWSFFLDYFVNIGDVLDAWSMRLVKFAWLNQTTRSRRTDSVSDPIFTPTGGVFHFTGGGGQAVIKRFDVNRVPISNSFDNNLIVKIPGWGSTKWLNIAALAQMRRRPVGS